VNEMVTWTIIRLSDEEGLSARRRPKSLSLEQTEWLNKQCQLISDDFDRSRRDADGSAKLFGKLNGWRLARSGFELPQLGTVRGRNWIEDYKSIGAQTVFDHLVRYSMRSRPMCLISMPHERHIDAAKRLAGLYGLQVLEPPRLFAGWWLPGATHCFAFVRPDTPITWLAEQMDTTL
jgi:hypothetical protein